MFVTVHALSGIAIASIIPNPMIAVPLAFGGHFLLDAFPHWTPLESKYSKWSVNISSITDL